MELLIIDTTIESVRTAIKHAEIQYIICNVRNHIYDSISLLYFTVEIYTKSGKTHICYFKNKRARDKQFNYIIKSLESGRFKEVANEA